MAEDLTLHASAVAIAEKGCLIIGASGSGKSSLALDLIAHGAELIADDRCLLQRQGDAIEITAPAGLPHAIEARGVGLLSAKLRPSAPLHVVVDLDQTTGERLPEKRTSALLGLDIPCLHNPGTPHFAIAIRHYLQHGFADLTATRSP